MKIILENIRGFDGRHELKIKPITILLGDNSSGKSTVLACISSALQKSTSSLVDGFNRAPFELGSYDTIATFKGGKYGRAESFSIGIENENPKGDLRMATFVNERGIPVLSHLIIENNTLSITLDKKNQSIKVKNKLTGKTLPLNLENGKNLFENSSINEDIIIQSLLLSNTNLESLGKLIKNPPQELFAMLHSWNNPTVKALAPIRTRPNRTYDRLIEDFKPEGDHVPLILSRLLSDSRAEKHKSSLIKFGQDSGLFNALTVKRMSKSDGGPFQLRVKTSGPDVNLVDVGYGVSQALPVVVDALLANKNDLVLVQQPEVHLHPRAQAALGSFFADQATVDGKKFVIETHSDYLIDRLRILIAEKKLSNKDVNIIFLQKSGLDVIPHSIEFDPLGNFVNPPDGFRAFFLDEEYKFLTRGQQ